MLASAEAWRGAARRTAGWEQSGAWRVPGLTGGGGASAYFPSRPGSGEE